MTPVSLSSHRVSSFVPASWLLSTSAWGGSSESRPLSRPVRAGSSQGHPQRLRQHEGYRPISTTYHAPLFTVDVVFAHQIVNRAPGSLTVARALGRATIPPLVFDPVRPEQMSQVGTVLLIDDIGKHGEPFPSSPFGHSHLSNLRNQSFVGEALAHDGIDETSKPVQRVPLDVAFVQPPRKLLDVAVKMFRAGVVVDAVQPALQDGPHALNRVGGHQTPSVLPGAVVHRLMLVEQSVEIRKDHVVIGVERGANFCLGEDFTVNGLDCALRYDAGAGSSAALPHPEHGNFSDRAASRVELLRFVLVALFATDERFVDLDHALELVDGVGSGAGFPQASEHEPCRLLGNADFLGKLHRTDTFPGRDQEVHGVDPLVKRYLRPLENRSRPHGEVEVAGVAMVKPEPLGAFADALRLAVRANGASGPETTLQINPRGLIVREHLEQLERADGGLRHLGSLPGTRVDRVPRFLRDVPRHVGEHSRIGPVPVWSGCDDSVPAFKGILTREEVAEIALDVVATRHVGQAIVLVMRDHLEVLVVWACHNSIVDEYRGEVKRKSAVLTYIIPLK